MRNVFVLIDGTRCTLASKTNIEAIYALSEAGGYRHHYQPGVGTYTQTKRRDEALAADIEGRAISVYQTLVEMQLNKQDRLYIFGYSRGAVIARTLAMCIASKEQLIAAAQGPPFKRTVPAQIEFLCLFEPVIGWPRRFKTYVANHEAVLEPKIKNYLELLALEERGVLFRSDSYVASGKAARKITELRRVSEAMPLEEKDKAAEALAVRKTRKAIWFPGMHGEIGGQNGRREIALHTLATALDELFAVSDAVGAEIEFPAEHLTAIKMMLGGFIPMPPPRPVSKLKQVWDRIGQIWGRRCPPSEHFAQHIAHPLCAKFAPSVPGASDLPTYPDYKMM